MTRYDQPAYRLGDVSLIRELLEFSVVTGAEECSSSYDSEEIFIDLHWIRLLDLGVHKLDSTTPPGIREALDRLHVDPVHDVRRIDGILEVYTEGTDTTLTVGDTIDDGVLQGEVEDLPQTSLTTGGST